MYKYTNTQVKTVRTANLTVCVLSIVAETSPQAGDSLADGSHPTAVLLCADNGHRPDLYGADCEEEAPVRGCIQSECSGAGWSAT